MPSGNPESFFSLPFFLLLGVLKILPQVLGGCLRHAYELTGSRHATFYDVEAEPSDPVKNM